MKKKVSTKAAASSDTIAKRKTVAKKSVAATEASPSPPAAKAAPKTMKKKIPSDDPTPARIIVHCDAGWGNTLHIRGEGEGLSWTAGIPLACVGDTEWTWTAPITAPILFKILINDSIWSAGENFALTPGELLTITPGFSH